MNSFTYYLLGVSIRHSRKGLGGGRSAGSGVGFNI